jgi:phosphohistidine phosphatase
MARQLWLLRHAEAEPHGTRSDSERRLTPRGEAQASTAGIALERMQAGFDAILFSPKVRAKQTAELAGAEWSKEQRERLEVHPPLAGGFGVSQALARLADVPADGRLLLIGHEPDLSSVIGEITGGRVDLKKGGVGAVTLKGAGGELAVLMRPRELALIAGGVGGVPIDGH